jgi:CBS domain-containing protein
MASIRDRFVRNVVCLAASATCDDAARVMAHHGIGSVGVRRLGRLVGLVTDRDLVAQLAAGADPAETTLEQAMRPELPAVSADATDVECAKLMRAKRTRHLAVREGAELVGVISMLDLVDLVVAEKQASIDELEAYIRGGRAMALSEPIRTVFHHEPVAAAAR